MLSEVLGMLKRLTRKVILGSVVWTLPVIPSSSPPLWSVLFSTLLCQEAFVHSGLSGLEGKDCSESCPYIPHGILGCTSPLQPHVMTPDPVLSLQLLANDPPWDQGGEGQLSG